MQNLTDSQLVNKNSDIIQKSAWNSMLAWWAPKEYT